MADLIERQLTSFPHSPSVQLFFSAHGVPLSYVEEAGDPYREEMQECVGLIIQELQRRGVKNPHTLAYQSRVGPVSLAIGPMVSLGLHASAHVHWICNGTDVKFWMGCSGGAIQPS